MKSPRSPFQTERQPATRAFTLVELLAVVSVVVLMMVAARPAVEALSGANSVNRAASDFSGLVQYARTYALSNNTYVRLALLQVPGGEGSTHGPRLYLIPFYSANGAKGGDMADARQWRQLGNPLVLEYMRIEDGLESAKVDLSGDFSPLAAPAHGRGTNIPAVSRSIPAISQQAVTLDAFVQFTPLGEVTVRSDELVRHVTVACDRAAGARGTNPFIVRISGANGTIRVLRKEDL